MWSAYGNEPLATAFLDRFGREIPEVLNDEHHLTIVAGSLDAATERIVTYLAEHCRVLINVALFTHVVDGDQAYLARTWLLPDVASESGRRPTAGRREPWNGVDLCFEMGELNGRSWDDGRTHGFVSAGGGPRYTGRLRELPPGSRLWVHLPKTGYVGQGVTTGPAELFTDARQPGAWLETAQLVGGYSLADREPDEAEWLVPVRWVKTLPREQAVWERGMYVNQSIVTQLRQPLTLEVLKRSPLAEDRVSSCG